MSVAFPTRILFFSVMNPWKILMKLRLIIKTTPSINSSHLKSRWLENKSERLEKQQSTAHYWKLTCYEEIAKHVKPVNLTDWMFLSITQKSIKQTYLHMKIILISMFLWIYVIIMSTDDIVCLSFSFIKYLTIYCRSRSN